MTTSTPPRSKRRAQPRGDLPGDPRLGSDVQARLGTLLRRMYGDLLSEPVPDRFLEILKGYRPRDPEERP